jgi:2'-5' RNA ligase
MDALEKEIESRYDEIKAQMKAIFEANAHITGWDVPEVDDKKAKKLLVEAMQRALDEIKREVL